MYYGYSACVVIALTISMIPMHISLLIHFWLCITSGRYLKIIARIWVDEYFKYNKYHRGWCTLAGGTQWVGHSCVTSAHFGPCACLGSWLLATDHDNSGSLRTTVNPVT